MPDGRVVVLMRERYKGYLCQSESVDGGLSWTFPTQTPMWGGPAHLLGLRDGRVVAFYGHRRPPYGVLACVSEDGGRTWEIGDELAVHGDMMNANCGYPTAVEAVDAQAGTVFVAHYGEDEAAVTHIVGTRVQL